MKKNGDQGTRTIKRITLHRETIARLTFGQLDRVAGGKGDPPETSLASCQETVSTCLQESDACV
jgi:hypothetical protein